jgi:hypothetical protein
MVMNNYLLKQKYGITILHALQANFAEDRQYAAFLHVLQQRNKQGSPHTCVINYYDLYLRYYYLITVIRLGPLPPPPRSTHNKCP